MMKKFNCYFEVDVCGFDIDHMIECGFIPANTYCEAMDALEEYFGADLNCVSHLELLDVGIMTMPKDLARDVLKANDCLPKED
jgi:hypothetical protein